MVNGCEAICRIKLFRSQVSAIGYQVRVFRYGYRYGPEPAPGAEHLNPGPDGRDPRPENASRYLYAVFPQTKNKEPRTAVPSSFLCHPSHLPLYLAAFLRSRSVSLALTLAAISDLRTSARRTPRSLASGDMVDSIAASFLPADRFFRAGLLGYTLARRY